MKISFARSKMRRAIALLLPALLMGVALSSCHDYDDEPYYNDWTPDYDYRLPGIWALVSDIDYGYREVFALSISADGTGVNGTWDLGYENFYPEGPRWQWWVDGNRLYMDDGRVSWEHYSVSPDGMYANIGGYQYVRVR